MRTKKLDHTTRQSIAKKFREGVRPQVLAREYGVTVRTVYRCAQLMRDIQIERGSRTEVIVCRVSPADLAQFDAKLKEAGIRNRSEALLSMKGALNKVGNNVTQIAKRMNDAKNQEQPLPFAEDDLMEMRHLAGFILDFADEADLMARGRRAALELKISDELKRMAKRGV